MKKAITLLLALIVGLVLQAQTFLGSMTIASFGQKNVKCTLTVDSHGHATLVMQRVKFAKLMPVRVDMAVSGLTAKQDADGNLRLTGIIPTAGGRTYPKKTITDFHGTVRGSTLSATFTMSQKTVTYTGTKQK